jgi:hypothetical protein
MAPRIFRPKVVRSPRATCPAELRSTSTFITASVSTRATQGRDAFFQLGDDPVAPGVAASMP